MSGKFGNNLIAKIGLDGKLIEKIGNKSYNIKNKPTIGYSQATNINFDLNEKQKKIAIGYLHFDKIEILNLNGQKNKIIIGPDQLKPKFKYKGQTLSNKNLKKAYYDIESNDEYIYALYSGKYGINRQKGQYVYNYPAIIHKFDWEGNPIAKYILDKQIIEFEIDFNRDQIIALDAETDNTFITYNLHNK